MVALPGNELTPIYIQIKLNTGYQLLTKSLYYNLYQICDTCEEESQHAYNDISILEKKRLYNSDKYIYVSGSHNSTGWWAQSAQSQRLVFILENKRLSNNQNYLCKPFTVTTLWVGEREAPRAKGLYYYIQTCALLCKLASSAKVSLPKKSTLGLFFWFCHPLVKIGRKKNEPGLFFRSPCPLGQDHCLWQSEDQRKKIVRVIKLENYEH